MSVSAHVDNKIKDILILGRVAPQQLDDIYQLQEKMYPIIFTENVKTVCFSLHCNGVSSYLFVHRVEIKKI